MIHPYLATLLCVPCAVVSAGVQVPSSVDTAADLLQVFKQNQNPTREEARYILHNMPIPENGSVPFCRYVRITRVLALLAESCVCPTQQRAELDKQIETLMPEVMFLLRFADYKLAEGSGDKALTSAALARFYEYTAAHPELGLAARTKPELSDFSDYSSEQQAALMEAVKQYDLPDSLASWACMQAFGQHGVVQDADAAMVPALRAVVMEKMPGLRMDAIRTSVGLSVVKAASLKGKNALPLKLAALRMLFHDADKEGVKVAAYLLAHTYGDVQALSSDVTERMAHHMLHYGYNAGHPACAQELAVYYSFTEDEFVAESYSTAAERLGYNQSVDYLNDYNKNSVNLEVNTPAVDFPDADERKVSVLICYLYAVAAYQPELQSLINTQSTDYVRCAMSLSGTVMALNGKSFDEVLVDSSEQPDCYDEEFDLSEMDGFMHIFGVESDEYLEYKEMLKQHRDEIQHDGSDEPMHFIRYAAQQGNPAALYHLAAMRIKQENPCGDEALEAMEEAYQHGSGDAAWFLFNAMKNEQYGMQRDMETMIQFYADALAFMSADAWKQKLEQAETDAERLTALAHLALGSASADYVVAFDDALIAYAEHHAEVASIVPPLRFRFLETVLRRNSKLSAETEKELENRLLHMAMQVQPTLLTEKELSYNRDRIDYQYCMHLNDERMSDSYKAVKVLNDNRADVVVVKQGKIVAELSGDGLTVLKEQSAEVLKGSTVVLRRVTKAEAELLLQSGVKAVSALSIMRDAMDMLRRNGIAAGGVEIIAAPQSR